MAGNLCRCTGYQNIVKAVQSRGEEARDGNRLTPASTDPHRRHRHGRYHRHDRARDQAAGHGRLALRKEDARFIRGQGTYVDDIKLPGMLFGAIVRSPYAHARIKSIDKSKALAVPGVVAVLTADDLKPVKLHWMPTLGGDVQAVLADKKVCFQMQEVAMVIASDRYAAADGVDAVEVEYEELPAIVDPHQSMAPDAPIIRDDIADKDDVGHGPRTHPNHIFTWEAGDKAGDRRRVRQRRSDGPGGDPQPARAPVPAGDLRLRRVVRQAHRPADGLHDLAGAAPGAHGGGDALRHSRRARSASSAATSAAASATRCRSTPAMSSRSWPRS